MEVYSAGTGQKIRVAVIIGHHAFDAPGFWRMFYSFPHVEVFPQTLSNFCADYGGARDWYDVVLFYNYHQETPGGGNRWGRKVRETLEELGAVQQGIVILHHGLVAFPEWSFWAELCGLPDRRFQYYPNQTVAVRPVRSDHPITAGLATWEMVDEIYQMEPAGADCDVLLATDHPNSTPTLAWTRTHGKARVFCCQPGHDIRAYSHAHFRAVLARAIAWTARC